MRQLHHPNHANNHDENAPRFICVPNRLSTGFHSSFTLFINLHLQQPMPKARGGIPFLAPVRAGFTHTDSQKKALGVTARRMNQIQTKHTI